MGALSYAYRQGAVLPEDYMLDSLQQKSKKRQIHQGIVTLPVTAEHLEFGPFRVDSRSGRLLLDGVGVDLRPKAYCALKTLIHNSGRYVDYDQMIQDAWEGTRVSRHTVAVTIAEVKRALGEYGSWITHRPKVGYRLEAPGSEDLIREGWHFWNRCTREGLEKGLECFEHAAFNDPSDHRAFEGIAVSCLSLATYGMRPTEEVYQRFLKAHRRAVELSGMTPELRAEWGHGLHVFERNFAEAEVELERALREKPKWPGVHVRLTMLYATQGRFSEAIDLVEKSRTVDPLGAPMPAAEIFVRLCQRDFVAAAAAGRRGVELHPYQPLGRALLAQALEALGDKDEALRQYHLSRLMCPDLHWLLALEGCCLAGMGEIRQACEILGQVEQMRETDYVDAYFVALLYHAMGRTDGAFRELERAVEENSATLFLLDVDVRMDPLRRDPRFAALRDRAFHSRPLAHC
jgi:DNA-binding winged helix-turn-helix (wHTH) protein/tetratricopeptide (TPR) repeat protein